MEPPLVPAKRLFVVPSIKTICGELPSTSRLFRTIEGMKEVDSGMAKGTSMKWESSTVRLPVPWLPMPPQFVNWNAMYAEETWIFFQVQPQFLDRET